jgi:hypothetical protein
LSDKIIVIAIMILDDGVNTGGRRLLSVVSSDIELETKTDITTSRKLLDTISPISDEEKIKEALLKITENPRSGAISPLSYPGVSIGSQIASIVGVDSDPWVMLRLNLFGKFNAIYTPSDIQKMVSARLARNVKQFCTTCKSATPVFYNLHEDKVDSATSSNARRRLLQTVQDSSTPVLYNGTVSIMLSYSDLANSIYFSELFNAMLNNIGSNQLISVGDSNISLQQYIKNVENLQLVLYDLQVVSGSSNATKLIFDMRRSATDPGGDIIHTPHPTTPFNFSGILDDIDDMYQSGAASCNRTRRDYTFIMMVFLLASFFIN